MTKSINEKVIQLETQNCDIREDIKDLKYEIRCINSKTNYILTGIVTSLVGIIVDIVVK